MDLDRWIAEYRGPLVGLLASWGATWRDADELAQDTFAEAYRAYERFRGDADDPEAVGAWLRGIAFRLFSHWQRARAKRGLPLEAAREPSVEADDAGDDRAAAIRAAIERLPGKLRAVLWMRYLEGCPVKRVAALLGETEKAVESRLVRARKELKRQLLETTMTSDGRLQE